ncbi:MAG: hypothetical protein ACJZ4X_04040 [Candidatus Thalassarchaeaceae archaeon]
MLDYDSLHSWADRHWESSIIPSLSEFISIEALSPGFEPEWERKGGFAEGQSICFVSGSRSRI